MAKNTPATKNENNLPAGLTNDLPAYLANEEELGKENLTAQDLELPRLAIAQALSKVCNPRDPAHIDGIKQGDIYNTLTQEIYGESVNVIPLIYKKVFQVWDGDGEGADRQFYGQYETEQEAIERAQQEANAVVQDAAMFLVLIINGEDPDLFEQAIIMMSSSAWKAARRWNSLVRMSRGSRFARAYQLSSMPVDGKKGFYYTWGVKALGYIPENWYAVAKEQYELLSGMNIKAAEPTPAEGDFEDDDMGF